MPFLNANNWHLQNRAFAVRNICDIIPRFPFSLFIMFWLHNGKLGKLHCSGLLLIYGYGFSGNYHQPFEMIIFV